MNKIASLFFVFVVLTSFPLVLAHGETGTNYDGHHEGMMSGFYGGYGFMWVFGWLFMILIIVALILFILWAIKQLNKKK